jgi:hypothetical protein
MIGSVIEFRQTYMLIGNRIPIILYSCSVTFPNPLIILLIKLQYLDS